MPLTIAVLGAGQVGRTLAAGWARAGHRIVLGSRDPEGARARAAAAEIRSSAGTADVTATTHRAAAQAADVVVLALPGGQVPVLIAELGTALRDTIVVDATNNTAGPVMNSVAELAAAGATVFRAFNSVGWEQMQQPTFGQLRADMPFAGPWTVADAQLPAGADVLVARLIGDIGFRPIALGSEPAALDAVDGLARLWFLLAFRRGYGRRVGFRILTADDEAQPGP